MPGVHLCGYEIGFWLCVSFGTRRGNGSIRLVAYIAEILPTRSSHCIGVIAKICCHEFEEQHQTAP
jgi:hypothetical protein